MSRLMLLPGVPALWRGPHSLQLGLDPRRSVQLEFGNPAVVRLLRLLDGTRTEHTILAEAGRHGVSSVEVRALLGSLRDHGMLVAAHTLLPNDLPESMRQRMAAEATTLALREDAPGTPAQILRRRANARVKITGRGRLGVPIALALA